MEGVYLSLFLHKNSEEITQINVKSKFLIKEKSNRSTKNPNDLMSITVGKFSQWFLRNLLQCTKIGWWSCFRISTSKELYQSKTHLQFCLFNKLKTFWKIRQDIGFRHIQYRNGLICKLTEESIFNSICNIENMSHLREKKNR